MSLRLLYLLAVTALIGACVGCGPRANPVSAHRELAAQLESETVAFVVNIDADGEPADDGTPLIYCAGVWVGPNLVLTASHCVQPDFPLHIRTQDSEVQWDAHLVARRDAADLALVGVPGALPEHPSASVQLGELADGDRVEFVGHPRTHGWSYAEGYVSASRSRAPNADGTPMGTLQIEGPVSQGNSGCGAWDANGDLVGIASYIEGHTFGMGFFVDRHEIRAFLAGQAL